MKRIGTTTRIALAMAMWTTVVLIGLQVTGVLDDGQAQRVRYRARLSEAVAVHCSQLASRGDLQGVQVALQTLVARDPEVWSAACLSAVQQRPVLAGQHDHHWQDATSSANKVVVPVMDGAVQWGEIQLAFAPLVPRGWSGFWQLPFVQVTGAALLANFLGFLYILRRSFRRLDPSQAVPDRVRTALNTMAELVVVLDDRQTVMLANDALARFFNRTADSLQGSRLEELPWRLVDQASSGDALAERLIADAAHDNESAPVQLLVNGQSRTLKPNASCIRAEDGSVKGTLLCLDDITLLAARTEELQQTMNDLRKSRVEVEQQNEQLRYLATRDSLTGCLNRRSFFELFQDAWNKGRQQPSPRLACLMLDIDYFKAINDNHGHAVGDEVLKAVSQQILEAVRANDAVCRYGGEEFCVSLYGSNLENAITIGERIRQAVEGLEFSQLSVSISVGCTDLSHGAHSMESLLEQADQALYAAKRSGRNQVVAFDAELGPAQEAMVVEQSETMPR